jgi:hypothetical protein
MTKQIHEELYAAFEKCHFTNFDNEEIHAKFHEMATEFLGTEDAIEHGRLVVKLTKILLEIRGDWTEDV